MITTFKMLIDKPRALHVIPTRRNAWRAPQIAGLLAATAVGTALLAAALSGHNVALAAKTGMPTMMASQHNGAVIQAFGRIDHSVLANSNLLPEPNASLLHSDPNAYVNDNAANWVLEVAAIPRLAGPHPAAASQSQ